jgi:hypothetical protein
MREVENPMLDVIVEYDRVRIGARFSVSFQRTLRVPDDGRSYPLPPGLGPFPVRRVEDFADRVPDSWREAGGAFVPMYQREALWLGFEAADWKPNAVKVGLGSINALTGGPWDETLRADTQDYLVCPTQPWLDGIKSGDGRVRQFVAMPLESGHTVAAQLGGDEHAGAIRIAVFEPKPGRFPDAPPPRRFERGAMRHYATAEPMGLAAGGAIKQKVYPDPYGVETWDPDERGCVAVHIVNGEQYRELTGDGTPPTPVDAQTYTRKGFPWFALYDESAGDLRASEALAKVKSVGERDAELAGGAAAGEQTLEITDSQIHRLGRPA